jgi:hypothetical protein
MKIEPTVVTVRELAYLFRDDGVEGVFAYGGKLNIRPPYQREFVYSESQRLAVVDTVRRGFPLNVMYWAAVSDGKFEVIDGQQRSISICQYVNSDFSHEGLFFHNLPQDHKEQILDYELQVYTCDGKASERLNWFRTINISGVKLTDQELRNAVYSGPWVSDAKRYFSRPNCPAQSVASKYLPGTSLRQEYLEKAIDWASKGTIEDYMGRHQKTTSALDLWIYFESIIDWAKVAFPKYRSEMKGVAWGPLFDSYQELGEKDPEAMESIVSQLMLDDEVTNKKGIYTFVFDGDERNLNIRTFSEAQRRESYERQDGKCTICGKQFELSEMHADHITPWSKNGRTHPDNCQMLCAEDNRRKQAK